MLTVGLDLIEIDDVRRSLSTFGDRYVDRVFTGHEQSTCAASAVRLAETFAAKEATVKALGYDGAGLNWRAVEVDRETRTPVARLIGPLAELARRRGVTGVTVTCTHDRHHAAAVVVVEAVR